MFCVLIQYKVNINNYYEQVHFVRPISDNPTASSEENKSAVFIYYSFKF